MLTQLSGLDASFLYLETGRSFGHVSSVMLFDRPDDPDYDPYAAYRANVEREAPNFLPLRRRLVEVPFGLDHPYWAEDPDFDLDYHLRHVAVPPPGGQVQLEELVSRIIGRPLDRSKPLWETYIIEGLHDGGFAVMTKIHHATIDGAAGAYMTQQFLTPADVVDVRERSETPEPSPPPPLPEAPQVLAKALLDLARRPGRALRWQRRMISETARILRAENRREVLNTVHRVPPTPFNHSITPRRSFVFRSVPLSRVKAIKSALGVTLNDVVLATSAGALRAYLQHHDALPDEPLVAMVPVSIRTGEEEDPWTNRVSSLFADLPTDLDDARARVDAIGATMADGKARHDLIPAELLLEGASLAPGRLALQAARLATNHRVAESRAQPANVVISNVPGPRDRLMLGDAPLRHYIPVSTVVDGQGLNITVQSYLDTLDIGIVACRELVPDVELLANLHLEELDVLEKLAGVEATS